MAKSGFCQVCGVRGHTEWHHILGRKGSLMNDSRFIVEICQNCHMHHSRTDILKRIFIAKIQQHGNHWPGELIDTVKDAKLHKPKEVFLAYMLKTEPKEDVKGLDFLDFITDGTR